MAFSLEGHVAIVTGNSSGLGKEIGMALGQAGAKVPVNFCYNEERAQSTLKEYQTAARNKIISHYPLSGITRKSAIIDSGLSLKALSSCLTCVSQG